MSAIVLEPGETERLEGIFGVDHAGLEAALADHLAGEKRKRLYLRDQDLADLIEVLRTYAGEKSGIDAGTRSRTVAILARLRRME